MAIRFKQVTADEWPLERIRPKDVIKRHKKYNGQVMFPSSHDITPNNLDACLTVMKNLLDAGNRVLVVSKPHLECIKRICDEFEQFKDQILFRFSIGACDDRILSYWEPHAPSYDERKRCLIYAFDSGFQTSVSVEPMLDSANIDILISELLPYTTHSIWIGTMNHLGRIEKGSDMVLKQATNRIRQGQIDTQTNLSTSQKQSFDSMEEGNQESSRYTSAEEKRFGYLSCELNGTYPLNSERNRRK
jgi:DNA repair photolyase